MYYSILVSTHGKRTEHIHIGKHRLCVRFPNGEAGCDAGVEIAASLELPREHTGGASERPSRGALGG